jgi:hypothetical protein
MRGSLNVDKECTSQFKAVPREKRERIMRGTNVNSELMPTVGKYTPKFNVIEP